MNAEKLLKEKVVRFLQQLGLSEEQAHTYMYLLEHGPQTVLALSRGLKSGRTKLYPLLEDLALKQLITIHERHYGTSYEALPPETLEFLIAEKERKAEALRDNFSSVKSILDRFHQVAPTTSRIVEYRGIDGLKQMSWNLTKTSGEYRVLELQSLSKHLGTHFAEKLHTIWAKKKIHSLDLTNNPQWTLETKVEAYRPLAEARYINPGVFTIEFETYIYNNCVALLNYEQNDIFGVEIYNSNLARQQKQLFNLLWSQAKSL